MRNTFDLNRSLGGAIAIIAAIALLSSGLILTTLNRLNHAADVRAQSFHLLAELDTFQIAMLDQETGVRGYLLTGRDESLEPYRSGQADLKKSIANLRAIVGKSSTEASRIAAAEDAAQRWQTDIGDVVARSTADPSLKAAAAALEANGTGKQHFDHLRDAIMSIRDEEAQVLATQDSIVTSAGRLTILAVSAGALVTLAICAGVGIAINRLIVHPLLALVDVMRRLVRREFDTPVPSLDQRNEVGEIARAVDVFKHSMIEFDRTSLLRVTADTLPAMVGYVTASRRIGFLNGEFERWFDLRSGDLSEVDGRDLDEVFASDPFPGASRELEAAFAGEEMRFEHQLARRGGDRRDLEAFYRPHRATDGRVLGVVTLLTDITERKKLTRRLASQTRDLMRSNEELEQFAYVASHDLKAPLRGIENLVGWIEEDLDEALTGDIATNMGLLKSRVRRLESLLDDLLTYSRAGRSLDDLTLVDTRALVREIAVLVSPPAGFVILADPSLPAVQAQRAPLLQVFQNLIGNAIKHHDNPSGGHIWVDSFVAADSVEFVVSDDGPGVPERFRERVFGMFQTLRPRDEVEGSGMGLAIVKKLIERQQGRIWLTDRVDGRGLAVHFTWSTAAVTGVNDGTAG